MTTNKSYIVDWVKQHTRELYAFAFSKVHQKETSEDLVQDTFVSAYQSFDRYQNKSSVKTWLFSILKHKIADYYRLKYKVSQDVPLGINALPDIGLNTFPQIENTQELELEIIAKLSKF